MCGSLRSSSGRAAGLLWSRRPQEGLWPRGSAFYGAAERTQLAAVVTHTPQRGPAPGHPSLSQGMGWMRAGSRSLAALGGLRAQDCPWGRAVHPGMAGKVTALFPRTRRARGRVPAPSRSSGSLPGTWHGALARAAARRDRRPQLGCRCQPGRRGHAEPDGCSVPLPAPQRCPQGAGRCPSRAAALGLPPGFLGSGSPRPSLLRLPAGKGSSGRLEVSSAAR